MPVNGRISKLHRLRLGCYGAVSAANSGTGPFSNSYSAVLDTYVAINTVFDSNPIHLQAESEYSSAGASSWGVVVDTPGGSWSDSGSGYLELELELELGFVVYNRGAGAGFRIVVSVADVYVNGVYQTSLSGWTSDSSRIVPDSLPTFGTVFLTGAVAAAGQDGTGVAGVFESDAKTTGTIGGGIKWQIDSADSFVTVPVITPPTITDVPLSTESYGDHFSVLHRDYRRRYDDGDGYAAEKIEEMKQGSIFIQGNLNRDIVRLNSDFKAAVYRYAFPGATVRNQSTVGVLPPVVTSVDAAVYTAVPGEVGFLGPGTSTIEAPMAVDVVCPAQYGYSYERGTSSDSADYEPVVGGLVEQEVLSTLFPQSVDAVSGYRYHANSIYRLANTWANPHWSFLLATDDWEVDGGAETWNDYWSKVGQQWLNLPSIVSPNTRNHLISEGCSNDGKAAWCDSFLAGNRFLGMSRWDTKEITPILDHTMDSESEDLWSVDVGLISMDDLEITITPP